MRLLAELVADSEPELAADSEQEQTALVGSWMSRGWESRMRRPTAFRRAASCAAYKVDRRVVELLPEVAVDWKSEVALLVTELLARLVVESEPGVCKASADRLQASCEPGGLGSPDELRSYS